MVATYRTAAPRLNAKQVVEKRRHEVVMKEHGVTVGRTDEDGEDGKTRSALVAQNNERIVLTPPAHDILA